MSNGLSLDENLHIDSIARNPHLNLEELRVQILQITSKLRSPETPNLQTNTAQLGKPDTSNTNGLPKESSPQERMDWITNHLQEVLNPEILEDVVYKQMRPPIIYWGTAPTGRPHCGYFVPMLQIASFLRAGCTVKILLADIHGFLDNLQAASFEQVAFRAKYYKFVITELLKAVGVSVDRLQFVLGSSYQISEKYYMDMLKLYTLVGERDAKKAGSEVVKQIDSAPLSGLVYPLMQALDEEYLGVDAQFGGVDQRKIFTLAKDILPKIGYKQRAHLMNPMVPGLAGGKMSSSDPNSKIDVLDDADIVTKKLKKAFAVARETEGNGLLSFIEYVLLPSSAIKEGRASFAVERQKEEPLVYSNIEKIHEDYKADILTPQLLKNSVAKSLNALLEPVQKAFKASKEWQECEQKAYPPEPKKEKKIKDKGTRGPGATAAKEQIQSDSKFAGSGNDQKHSAANGTGAVPKLGLEQNLVENGQPA